jgi:glycosyltransferase involved in cell wall biosynthesis
MIQLAFGSVPKDSGTFTFYRNLRPALLAHGIEMRCVSVGKEVARLWQSEYADSGCILLAEDVTDIKQQAKSFADWCQFEQIDIVMGINSAAILSSIPHLSESTRVLSRCANGFDHGYRITLSGRERLAGIVAVSPRLAQDLIQKYDANPDLVHLIPNGINSAPFDSAANVARGQNEMIQLGFLGRLEHNQKGVLHLPKIAAALKTLGVDFQLQIAGKGKHRTALERAFNQEGLEASVRYLGALSPEQIPDFLAHTDILLFTSHFEGFPNALLEAMMAGCVPVAWQIDGITDYIIQDQKTGLLHKQADYDGFVAAIAALAGDRSALQRMSAAAAKDARARFTSQQTGSAYAQLIHAVSQAPPPAWQPRPWNEFVIDANFAPGWRTRLKAMDPIRKFLDRLNL